MVLVQTSTQCLAFLGCDVHVWSSPCGNVGCLISLSLLPGCGFSGPRAVAPVFRGSDCGCCWGGLVD